MKSHFTSDFFRGNREKLQSLFTGTAPIVITANGLLQRTGDTEYRFRQDSSFWYLTGVALPGALLVLDRGREYLIVPERDPVVEVFEGRIDRDELEQASGITEVLNEKDGWRHLGQRVKKVRHVATLAPPKPYAKRFGVYSNPARARLVKQLTALNSELELLDIRPHLARMRSVKQPLELSAIQTAIDITVETLSDIEQKLDSYDFEYQVEADLTHGFRSRGALGHAFSPVVASGKNTCTLHYVANHAPLAGARVMYLDVGAEYEHYAADITRTYFLKAPNKRESRIYQSVAEAHQFALSLLKPGLLMKDYEASVEKFMGEKLRELGLIKRIESETVRRYFPHATSHSLGLDLHDAMDYEQPLQSGMVVTVEPGIYIPEEGLGVRIEDDVLITESGAKVLSDQLPSLLK